MNQIKEYLEKVAHAATTGQPISSEDLLKFAGAVIEQSQSLGKTIKLASDLLTDNEQLSKKVSSLEHTLHTKQREEKIAAIVEEMCNKRAISRTEVMAKKAELANESDESLDSLQRTFANLGKKEIQKEAAESGVSSFEFLSPSVSSAGGSHHTNTNLEAASRKL